MIVINVGGLPDVVTNGKTGYVVEPRKPKKLAELIIDFYMNDREKECTEHIRESAYEFSWERMVETIEEIYKDIKKKEDKKVNIANYFNRPYKSWIPKKLNHKVKKIASFEVDIVSHCNLNCKGCTHFSPIAQPWYIDVEDFKKDIKRVSELIPDNKVGCLYILGGEPLLHKEIDRILVAAREAYEKLPIIIITNGLLLDKMDNQFWNTCMDNDISIEITKYPIAFDYFRIEAIMHKMKGKVKIVFKGRTRFLRKKQYRLPLDEKGKQDGIYGFRYCFMAGNCINLKNGHLYTCSYAACMEQFNKYFNKKIPVTKEDGIDIYKDYSTQQVLDKLSKPIPLCQYCAVKDRTYGNEWAISKKEYAEWALEDEK